MRKAFVSTLLALSKEDPSIVLVTGDLGFNALEEFRDTLPKQFLNAGVAEQNMVGIAAGFALSGKRVFVYSIIPFATLRCLEHVRNDIVFHKLPVCLVGVGSGYAYGILGSTHHSLEDIAVMRSLPGMTVVCPGDPIEVEASVRAIAKHGSPVYLRLGKAGEKKIHREELSKFQLGKALTLLEGKDIALLATGSMLETARDAALILGGRGYGVHLQSFHTLKPLDEDAVRRAASETRLIVTLEEHGPIGGLGAAVASVLSAYPSHAPHLCLSAPDAFTEEVGSQQYLRARVGLTPEAVAEHILKHTALLRV